MRFSIITPAYIFNDDRAAKFKKCIESIDAQNYDEAEFEHIIVNDGSPYEMHIEDKPWRKVINQPNLQRLTAYNTGLKAAQGEILCLLDSDDEYVPEFLGCVDWMYAGHENYKMFNFGCIFHHTDGVEVKRDPFEPSMRKIGHETFGGGQIVNGTFVFHRSIYDDLGAFPEGIKTIDVPWYKNTELFWTSPYDFSAYAQSEFPEIQPFFQVKHPDHPAGLPKELGNPYGNDFYLFYKYTRKYHSKPLKKYLLKVNLR